MDINPASDGHVLVIPKRHSRDLLDMTAEDLAEVTQTAQGIAKAVVEAFEADGVNLVNCSGAEAWQTVFHFHLHVVPRCVDKAKDRLALPWQPGAPADPGLLADLGSRLAAHL